LISPENWGFRVVFPRIGTDTVDALKEIISKTPKSNYLPKLKKLLVLANQRMKKEMRDWKKFHNLEKSSADRLLRFVNKNKSNIYTPKAEVLAAFKKLKSSFKRLAMSKLILTEGRLLPPSEDFGDKIAKLFGLPPKNYGNDEVVVRGAQVEFRGRKVYISGIIENKGSKTLNVNVLGLFQFKTISLFQHFGRICRLGVVNHSIGNIHNVFQMVKDILGSFFFICLDTFVYFRTEL
jgi:hypothetical protein